MARWHSNPSPGPLTAGGDHFMLPRSPADVRIVKQRSHEVNQPRNNFGFSRRQLLKYSGIGAAAVAGSSFLAACGGDDGGGGGGGGGGPQKSGGQLIHGATGGGSKDTIDPHQPVQAADIPRVCNLYEPLLFWNDNYELEPALAESV